MRIWRRRRRCSRPRLAAARGRVAAQARSRRGGAGRGRGLFDDLKMTCGPGRHAGDADPDPRRGGRRVDPRRHRGAGHPDRARMTTAPLGNRQACAFKEVFADALGPNGLVTDTRQNEHQADETGRRAQTPEPQDADERRRSEPALEDALIPEPRRPEPAAAPAPAPETTRGPGRALLTITMDHRWLQLAIGHGTLDSGALSDPATVRRWACDADIVPMVLGSKSEPLDIGRRSRLIPDAMRRAPDLPRRRLRVPRLHPTPPALPRPPHRALGRPRPDLPRQPHPAVPTSPPGDPPRALAIDMIDGLPWFTPPAWIDPERQPRPGGRSATVTA